MILAELTPFIILFELLFEKLSDLRYRKETINIFNKSTTMQEQTEILEEYLSGASTPEGWELWR